MRQLPLREVGPGRPRVREQKDKHTVQVHCDRGVHAEVKEFLHKELPPSVTLASVVTIAMKEWLVREKRLRPPKEG